MGKKERSEWVIGTRKYIWESRQEKDFLLDISEHEVKIHFTFCKDKKKNQQTKDAIKRIFMDLYA